MDDRLALHEELVSVLGSRNVYFQPPESVRMQYPCIIYSINKISTMFANDKIFASYPEYAVTVVDTDPDSTIAERLMRHFPYCRFDRRYAADNLYHDSLTLSYLGGIENGLS